MIPIRVSPAEIINKRANFVAAQPLMIIDSVTITGVTKQQKNYIKRLLSMDDNHLYTMNYMRSSYLRLFSDQNIYAVHPTVKFDTASGNGRNDV